jgi:ABC-type multidrug transport system ATPase subunit
MNPSGMFDKDAMDANLMDSPVKQNLDQSNQVKVNLETGTPGPQHPYSKENVQFQNTKLDIPNSGGNNQLSSTFWVQIRALVRKNASLQWKLKCTNCCQILTPLICLLFIVLIKQLAETQSGVVINYIMPVPFLFNIPYKSLYNAVPNDPINISECLQWYEFGFDPSADNETMTYVGQNNGFANGTSGLLSRIWGWECQNSQNESQLMPFFNQTTDSIDDDIYEDVTVLNEEPYNRYVDMPNLQILPDGAITFYNASDTNLTFKIQINDLRIPEYHRNNGVTKFSVPDPSLNRSVPTLRVPDGQLALLDLISRAYLNNINESIFLVSGSQFMPVSTSESALIMKIINLTGASLYPIALSLLLPVFMYAIVLEKEERLQEMMKMNGMNMTNYWLVNYLWNYLLYMVTILIFFLFGYFLLDLTFFTQTNFAIMFLVMNGWGLCEVSMAFFFQNFLAKARTATIAGYLLSIWQTIIAITFNVGVYPDPKELPYGMRMYPPFAFCRLIYDMSIGCSNYSCYAHFSSLTPEMNDCLLWLYLGAVIFLVLGLYLNEVLPQEFGVPKHPLFFLHFLSKKKATSKTTASDNYVELDENSNTPKNVDVDLSMEDEDSKAERRFVHELRGSYSEYPLVIKDIKKVYKAVGGRPPKLAVRCMSLAIRPGEMFGLLGPNGAGKTSLISILTGLYTPDAGNAWVAGYDIKNDITEVHRYMGVCPQFDLLWPDLTVEEHLLFYARIRGVKAENEFKMVANAMEEVYLTKFANFKTRQLSGGMKRRLSVAISLVGDPRIVFLDEPTTGLDPENRRQLWDILTESKRRRAMVLTTHSMEEADVLCTRIGIITDGTLRCVGSKVRLKTLYGGGYHLYINCHKDKYFSQLNSKKENVLGSEESKDQEYIPTDQSISTQFTPEYYHDKLKQYIKQILPRSTLKSEFNGNFVFLVPLEGLEVSTLFDDLEAKTKDFAISDWGISQSSLEDVFMEIVKTSESYSVDDPTK